MGGTKDLLLEKVRSGANLSLREQIKLASILSYPAILAQLSSVLMQYIDASMVGHLGAVAGASIGLVSTCTWLFGGFCMACSTGFSVQVAHLVGAKDYKGARGVIRQGLTTALLFSLMLGAVGFLLSGPLPGWIGGNDDINPGASSYLRIMALFLPAVQISWISGMMLQCSGNMKVPSILNVLMCVLDVIFNYIFIYKMGLGVTGAALGTGLAEAVTCLAMLYFLLFRSGDLRVIGEKGSWMPRGFFVQKATTISLPLYLQNIVLRGAHVATTIIVAPLGTIAIAANAFAITAESFCYMPGYGISDAATTLVGQSLGAHRKDLARQFARITIWGGVIIMTLISIIMYIMAPTLMAMLSPDKEVIDLGARMLRIVAFAETLYAASIVADGVCMGAGDTLAPSIMNFSSMWLVRVIPAIFLTRTMGLAGFWIAMAVELNFRGIIFLIRIRRGRWMDRKVVKETTLA